jgi:hypothetical protein
VRTPDPQAGAHAPDGSLAQVPGGERTSVFKLMSTLRHLLLIFTYRYDPAIHQLRGIAERHNEVVDAYVVAREGALPGANLADPAGAVFRSYGAEGEPQFVLIRPDGYVAMRAAARDAGMLAGYLERTFIAQQA